jgi:hypothetical protein
MRGAPRKAGAGGGGEKARDGRRERVTVKRIWRARSGAHFNKSPMSVRSPNTNSRPTNSSVRPLEPLGRGGAESFLSCFL